jgi:hypothetical protein
MEEYRSLLDATGFLPVGVFTNVQAGYYWTSTIDPYPISGGQVLIHRFDAIPENGTGVAGRTGSTFYVWCVRGGTGVDGM